MIRENNPTFGPCQGGFPGCTGEAVDACYGCAEWMCQSCMDHPDHLKNHECAHAAELMRRESERANEIDAFVEATMNALLPAPLAPVAEVW